MNRQEREERQAETVSYQPVRQVKTSNGSLLGAHGVLGGSFLHKKHE